MFRNIIVKFQKDKDEEIFFEKRKGIGKRYLVFKYMIVRWIVMVYVDNFLIVVMNIIKRK